MGPPAEARRFTYGDYLTWSDDDRFELVDGVAYDMYPAPVPFHQSISVQLVTEIAVYLRDRPCRLFHAPFDIRLPKGDEPDELVDTVVQPDIVVICDPKKIDGRGCRGAPDLAVEILSPSTAPRDLRLKFDLYEKHGVKEYWVVNPDIHVVHVFSLGSDGRYGRPRIFAGEEPLESALLPGLVIDLGLVFRR